MGNVFGDPRPVSVRIAEAARKREREREKAAAVARKRLEIEGRMERERLSSEEREFTSRVVSAVRRMMNNDEIYAFGEFFRIGGLAHHCMWHDLHGHEQQFCGAHPPQFVLERAIEAACILLNLIDRDVEWTLSSPHYASRVVIDVKATPRPPLPAPELEPELMPVPPDGAVDVVANVVANAVADAAPCDAPSRDRVNARQLVESALENARLHLLSVQQALDARAQASDVSELAAASIAVHGGDARAALSDMLAIRDSTVVARAELDALCASICALSRNVVERARTTCEAVATEVERSIK